jgi:small redox-active disulfide protein 2
VTVSSGDDVTKVKVGKFSVGIVGLKAALEETEQMQLSSNEEIEDYLLRILKKKNYIPPKSEPEHGRAFLREYKKFRGESFEVDEPQGLEVQILGPGCPNCVKLEQMVYKVMSEEGILGRAEHVKDLNEIASYGMVATPALVINGEIKVSGRLPRESQLREWLKQES